MSHLYDSNLKKKLCTDICLNGASTMKTANDYNIPLKTLEKWITAFNKNNSCFDSSPNDFHLDKPIISDIPYDDLSFDQLKKELMRKDIEIARLKKGYLVEGGGTEKKVFISLSKKNMK